MIGHDLPPTLRDTAALGVSRGARLCRVPWAAPRTPLSAAEAVRPYTSASPPGSSDKVHPAGVRVSVRPGLPQEDRGGDQEARAVQWQVATGNAVNLERGPGSFHFVCV